MTKNVRTINGVLIRGRTSVSPDVHKMALGKSILAVKPTYLKAKSYGPLTLPELPVTHQHFDWCKSEKGVCQQAGKHSGAGCQDTLLTVSYTPYFIHPLPHFTPTASLPVLPYGAVCRSGVQLLSPPFGMMSLKQLLAACSLPHHVRLL